MLRVLDLFSGIGGFSLGLEAAGMTTVGFCEIDPFCREVLAKHWPGVYIHDDIRSLTTDVVRDRCGRIELICGGVPCQPASCAGKRRGSRDDRWLWPDFLRLVREVKPMWVLAENVPGLVTLKPHGLDWIVSEMEASGYQCFTAIVGAWAVGAPHRRDRVWIVGRLENTEGKRERPVPVRSGRQDEAPADVDGASERVADAAGPRREGPEPAREVRARGLPAQCGPVWPARPGEPQHAWEAPRLVEFPLGGTVDGLPSRLVRFANRNALKAYGNAVLPQVVAAWAKVIYAVEQGGKW